MSGVTQLFAAYREAKPANHEPASGQRLLEGVLRPDARVASADPDRRRPILSGIDRERVLVDPCGESAMKKTLIVVGIVWLLAGLPLLAFGLKQLREDRHFATAGRHAVGVVVSKAPRAGNPNRTRASRGYFVLYRFATPERVSVVNEATMSQSAYNALDDGGPIDVVYLPEAPTQSRARGEYSIVWVVLPMGVVFTAVGVVCLGLGIRQGVSDGRLRRDGVLTEATVTDVVRSDVQINRVWQARVVYHFNDERGALQEGRSHLMPEPDAAHWTAGRRVYVRYDRARPSKSLWIGPQPD
jgi:hypothetical protein